MKKHKIITKITLLILIVVASACSKVACDYKGATACNESPFAGYLISTFASNGIGQNVGMIFNTQNNSIAPPGDDWNNPALGVNRVQSIQPAMWKLNTIGQVFGTALNTTSGVFLSATDIYRFSTPFYLLAYPNIFGSGGSAGIYYTDISTATSVNTTTTLVSTDPFNTMQTTTIGSSKIPNTGGLGNSIGNIAYDKANNQLFATNLEDGRIYRIDATSGKIKSIFDPFAVDVPSNGIAPAGEQLWGIGVYNDGTKNRVYFARTKTIIPFSTTDSAGTKDIWSIELTSSGEFNATEVGTSKLFTDSSSSSVLEIINVPGNEALVTDIAFSGNGKMLLAERGHPHKAKVLEYMKSGSSWVTANNFYVGGSTGNDSAGGVDYGIRETATNPSKYKCDDIVWATGNYMKPSALSGGLVYGVQGMSSSGNNPSLTMNMKTDLFLDYDTVYSYFKGAEGDVEVFRNNCCQ